MTKKGGSKAGRVDVSVELPNASRGKIKYSKVDKALRRNGLAVMRVGNKNKFDMGLDGNTFVVYGNGIYAPSRDKAYKTGTKWIDNLVEKVKGKVKKSRITKRVLDEIFWEDDK
jgi:hypothetical protein